ncbi:MAG: CoA-binding protein, partial [Candidatus Hermodarchaeota archaeon]
MNTTHFLHGFLYPKNVAFYGANNKGSSLAAILIMNLIKSGYDGSIYPIHLELESVMGYKAYNKIEELPEVPDLVVIVLSANIVPKIFRECGEKGVKRIILISGGFRELMDNRKNTLTKEICQIADDYGIRFIGPNCLGVFNNWYGNEQKHQAFSTAIWE